MATGTISMDLFKKIDGFLKEPKCRG